jgi:hypothetical protein
MCYYTNNELFGFGARLNYSSYKTDISLSELTQEHVDGLEDMDGDTYNLLSDGNTLKELASVSFFEVPLFLKLRFAFKNIKILNHVYMNVGPVISFSVAQEFETTGNFTYEGYYPEYHVLLYGIDEYGYYDNKNFSVTPESNMGSFNLSGFIEAGINIPLIGDKFNINVSLMYQKGLTNLSDEDEDYIFTRNIEDFNTLIDSREKISTSFFGLNIGLLYKLF